MNSKLAGHLNQLSEFSAADRMLHAQHMDWLYIYYTDTSHLNLKLRNFTLISLLIIQKALWQFHFTSLLLEGVGLFTSVLNYCE